MQAYMMQSNALHVHLLSENLSRLYADQIGREHLSSEGVRKDNYKCTLQVSSPVSFVSASRCMTP